MNLKCPFAAPITTGVASCRNAQEVVRRGGSEYDCTSAEAHATCTNLFERLKAQALPAFGVEDDLTSMPHSVLVKVQCGGLAGLKRIAEGSAGKIADIAALVADAGERYGSVADIPYGEIVEDMTSYKLERRTRRR